MAPVKRLTHPEVVVRKKIEEEDEDMTKDLEKLFNSHQRKLKKKKIETVVREEDMVHRKKMNKIAKILNAERPKKH